jgi:hypothetical protein
MFSSNKGSLLNELEPLVTAKAFVGRLLALESFHRN